MDLQHLIGSEIDEADGHLHLWRLRSPDAPDPRALAAAYHARILQSKARIAHLGVPVEVATALLEHPGFEIVGEGGGEFRRIRQGGIGSTDMTGVRVVTAANEPAIYEFLKRVDLIGENREDLQRVFAANGYNVFIAEAGQDVAFGSAIHGNGAGWISYVAVLPSARGRGLGRRLMAILLAELDKVSLTHSDLDTSGSPAALRLFKRFGFVRITPLELKLRFERRM